MCVLAVDAGTSMIKTVVFDDDGTELAVIRQPTEVNRPRGGWAEQDMVRVWNAVMFTVREARTKAPDPIKLLALTAQGDGCWLVDDAGRPTGPAVLWSDARATEIVEAWRADGTLTEGFRRNGSLTFAGLPNAVLRWFAAHDPDRLARSSAALTCGGWLFLQLTGEVAVDVSDASAPLLDPSTRRYSDELCELFGLGPLTRLLPPVRDDDERVAGLRPEAATDLGLPAGLPVVLAPYDIASTAIGCGAVSPGQACTILGTTLCTEVVSDDLAAALAADEPSGLSIAFGPDGLLRAYPTLAGTEVLVWAAELLDLDSPQRLVDAAASVDSAPGLTFLPYLSPAGERAPILEPRARGTVWGLTLEHGRAHVARAVLEGLTMVIRDCLQASQLAATEIRLCGGGARNDHWTRLIADVTGVRVIRSADSEVGAKGAFLTGLVATGEEPGLAAAADGRLRLREPWPPDPGRRDHYAERYRDFIELRSVSRRGWRR